MKNSFSILIINYNYLFNKTMFKFILLQIMVHNFINKESL